MENANVAPGPVFCAAQRRPPCRSMIERLTDNPMPIPSLFVVKNASNNRVAVPRIESGAGVLNEHAHASSTRPGPFE